MSRGTSPAISCTGQVVMALLSVLSTLDDAIAHDHAHAQGNNTNLFTCWPPGPLDREKTVLPLGIESAPNFFAHSRASARSAGSILDANASYLANLTCSRPNGLPRRAEDLKIEAMVGCCCLDIVRNKCLAEDKIIIIVAGISPVKLNLTRVHQKPWVKPLPHSPQGISS